ncbi:MAG: AbrB/MazE/SpoVT family DNA-binding domain-containing protein [Bacillaceae bacterium]|nr:AbrB/MazE/SpoVT family DNA-binding domain-containing protein [Bacillaceae bacterium]
MTTRLQKWGNSYGIRIPKKIAEQLNLEPGSELELTVKENCIQLEPSKKKPTLEELLEKISPENRHTEIDFGSKGNELL